MEDIIHVRPHNQGEKRFVESLITPTQYASPIQPVAIQVPISNQLDINQILQDNTAKFKTDNKKSELIQVDESALKVEKYTLLSALNVTNYYDQVSLIVFTQFKLDSKRYIELLFNQFIDHYRWSMIKNFDTVTVILSVQHLHELQRIYDNIHLFELVSSKVLSNFDQIPPESLLASPLPRPINETKITQLIQDLIEKNIHSHKATADNVNVSVDNYYNNYPVDSNELIDVPKLMKSKIVNELIRFRSKMLMKEHQKRQSELSKERVKAKQLLTSIFNNEDRSKGVSNDDMIDDSEYIEPLEEMPELNDNEYEDYLNQKHEKDMSNKYNNKLRQITQQKLQKTSLLHRVKQASQYEINLINNKFKLIDDLKSTSQGYHDFMKYRYKSYQYEEMRDNEDRERAKQEQGDDIDYRDNQAQDDHNPVPSEVEASSNEPVNDELVPPESGPQQLEQQQSILENIPLVPALDDMQKDSLHKKLESLVEQYIGIKEDDLIQYLYENLIDNSLTRDEVYETFDNDTDNLINDINRFIKSL